MEFLSLRWRHTEWPTRLLSSTLNLRNFEINAVSNLTLFYLLTIENVVNLVVPTVSIIVNLIFRIISLSSIAARTIFISVITWHGQASSLMGVSKVSIKFKNSQISCWNILSLSFGTVILQYPKHCIHKRTLRKNVKRGSLWNDLLPNFLSGFDEHGRLKRHYIYISYWQWESSQNYFLHEQLYQKHRL